MIKSLRFKLTYPYWPPTCPYEQVEETYLNSWEEALEQDLILQESSRTSLEKGQEVIPERTSNNYTRLKYKRVIKNK